MRFTRAALEKVADCQYRIGKSIINRCDSYDLINWCVNCVHLLCSVSLCDSCTFSAIFIALLFPRFLFVCLVPNAMENYGIHAMSYRMIVRLNQKIPSEIKSGQNDNDDEDENSIVTIHFSQSDGDSVLSLRKSEVGDFKRVIKRSNLRAVTIFVCDINQ